MATVSDDNRMLRKQYHLSAAHVRRIQALRSQLGLSSDAALIRRAIDSFDPEAIDPSARELVESVADDLRDRVQKLNEDIEATLNRAAAARQRLADPDWIEGVRERTRVEIAEDPALMAGVATLIGAAP